MRFVFCLASLFVLFSGCGGKPDAAAPINSASTEKPSAGAHNEPTTASEQETGGPKKTSRIEQAIAELEKFHGGVKTIELPDGQPGSHVFVQGSFITGDELKWLLDLPTVVELDLQGCRKLTDITHVKNLPHLRVLNLRRCEMVTDSAMANLASLQHLETLVMPPNVTNAVFNEMGVISSLRSLEMYGCTKLTDSGLAYLLAIPELKSVKLPPATTDQGFQNVSGLTKLEELGVSGAKVTDHGLLNLASLNNLTSLNLHYLTGVTDQGLHQLRGLSRLSKLNVQATKVTESGLNEFKQAFPKLEAIR